MQDRKLSVRIGAAVRTVDAYPYSLPKGLPGDAEATVVSYDLKTYNYVVRDAAGGESGTSRRCKISTLGVNTSSAVAGSRKIIRSCWQNCGECAQTPSFRLPRALDNRVDRELDAKFRAMALEDPDLEP